MCEATKRSAATIRCRIHPHPRKSIVVIEFRLRHFGYVDMATGKFESVEYVPGYARGLAMHGQFAFVGLSKIRETSIFGGVPIAEKRDELQCGMGVVDLVSGRTVAVFRFLSGVSEIFAVDVIPGCVNPLVAGGSVDRQEKEVWIVPAESAPRPKLTPRWPLFSSYTDSTALPLSDSETSEQMVAKSQQIRAAGDLDGAAELFRAGRGGHPARSERKGDCVGSGIAFGRGTPCGPAG